MDYKERYNKLLDAIKELQKANPSDEGIQNWINDNVPELKESEDERIRKEIIQHLKQNNGYHLIPEGYYDKWLAWLEREDWR